MDRLLTFQFRNDAGPPRYVLEGVAAENMWPEESQRTLASGNITLLTQLLQDLHSSVAAFRKRLDEAHNWGGAESAVWAYVDQLQTAGCRFWQAILGRAPYDWLDELNEVLTGHLPLAWWRSPKSYASLYEVQVKAPSGFLLPLDLLPLGSPEKATFGGPEDLEEMASIFGGFVARIRYDGLYAGSHSHPTPEGPRALLDLRSQSAPGYLDMAKRLAKFGPSPTVCGPYPSADGFATPEDVARSCATTEVLAKEGVVPDLVHIYCHGYTWEDPARTLILELVDAKNNTVFVDGGHFDKAMKAKMRAGGGAGPIVFLNACHSLGHIGSETYSTALMLVESGTRAVLGVRDEVPSSVAVAISDAVLRKMGDGAELGRAIVAARWELLMEEANPLGLLFAVFGDIDSVRAPKHE